MKRIFQLKNAPVRKLAVSYGREEFELRYK